MVIDSVPWHVAIRLVDMDTSLQLLSQTLGCVFTTPAERRFGVRTAEGDGKASVIGSFSMVGPPHLELIGPNSVEDIAISPWGTAESDRLHHIAYWTTDLAVDIQHMTSLGWTVEATGLSEDGESPVRFAYMLRDHQLRVELVDKSMKPGIDAWLAGGEPPSTK